MCGIYGTTKKYSNEILLHKLSLMKFRGPNHLEFKKFKKINGDEISLGHVRLSIIDLDQRSNQPFEYNDNISIVFNGEIYNYEELKRMHLKDIHFRTNCDTEVICAMYEKYGRDCVKYFNGMFAYVIFDKTNNVLVGARDRLGKKPFYYHLSKDSFEFASQVNPIKYNNQFSISDVSRQLYLLYGYISEPHCIYKEISKLRAGQMFTLHLDSYKIEIEQYWDIFSNSCNFSRPKSYEEAREQVKELLWDAVRIRLNADVAIGMFLSGGIDSSLISAIVSKINKNITAYTIGFNDNRFNESHHAIQVANALGVPIKINYCEGDEMIKTLKNISTFFDEPFADTSFVPTCLLSEKTSLDVTVALGGDGGDEFFYGYNSYFGLDKKRLFYKSIPLNYRLFLYSILKNYSSNHIIDLLQYEHIFDAHTARFSYGNIAEGLNIDIKKIVNNNPDIHYAKNKERNYLALSDYDIKHYMCSCINTKTDRASMRSSLELRSPLMDYRIAEYSRMIPYEYQYSVETGGKRILKDILFEIIPKRILERPKMGFGAPVGNWLSGPLKNDTLRVLSSFCQCDIPEINIEYINSIRNNLSAGMEYDDKSLFKIYTYLNWLNNRLK